MKNDNQDNKRKRSFNRFLRRVAFHLASFPIVYDKSAIKFQYKLLTKKRLDLKNPKTFNEKLNWMKLYYRKPLLTTMADKFGVKEYVKELIGEDYVIPLIGVYEKWDEIDFSKLQAPFVIKTTHSSGMVIVVRNMKDFDLENAKKRVNKSLKRKYFYSCREWPYKNIKPRIIIEKFVKDSKEENLPVYKFFCFDGEPFLVQTIKNDKTSYETIDYFDMDWKLLELKQNFENSEVPLDKPANFEEMKKLAKKLSVNQPFVRVDLYSVDGRIYFSEFTFFSDAGYQVFHPEKWDLILGEKIPLEKYGKTNR